MALMHELSALAPLPEYDIFTVPGTQASAERGFTTSHYPLAPVSANTVIEFQFPTARDEYVHFDQLLFRLKLRVDFKSAIDRTLTPDESKEIAFVNYPLETIFAQKDLQIGDTRVTSAQTTNAYRAILDSKLGFSNTAKKSWLTASMYSTSPHTDDVDPNLVITNGKEIELAGILHFDLTFQEKAMIGGLRYHISLLPNVPAFYLEHSNIIAPTVTFTEARLDVWRTRITPMLLEGHMRALMKRPAKYPIVRTDTKTVIINPQTYSATIDNVITGQIPNRIFICFVSNEAYKGAPAKDPFNFQHYNIDYIAVQSPVGTVPNNGYRLNFENGHYIDALLGLYTTAGQLCNDPRMSVSRESFKNGEAIFGFALSPDLGQGCTYGRLANPIKQGAVRIEVHFKTKLPETVTMLVRSEYDNLIMVNSDLNVAIDY